MATAIVNDVALHYEEVGAGSCLLLTWMPIWAVPSRSVRRDYALLIPRSDRRSDHRPPRALGLPDGEPGSSRLLQARSGTTTAWS